MERVIKFRALKFGSKEFAYGNLVQSAKGDTCIIEITPHDPIEKNMSFWNVNAPAYGVIPETVGQFTGLNDVFDNEIYEGDIINTINDDLGVIVYKDHCFEVTVSETQSSLYTVEWMRSSHVIGNIHQNPELLSTDKTKTV